MEFRVANRAAGLMSAAPGMKGSISTVLVLLFLLIPRGLPAGDEALLQGRILDKNSAPVAGAVVQVYNSPQVKRPADFISAPSSADGRFTLTLPAGTYWTVAVLRKSGQPFGPLGLDDRHSGEPLRLELAAGMQREVDLVILDLREAALQQDRKNQDRKNAEVVRISGRIIDSQGNPVALAYAAADREVRPGAIPAYISAWTDEQGRYSLYLERGRFHLGAAREFPPDPGFSLPREFMVTEDASGIDMVVNEADSSNGPAVPPPDSQGSAE